jgi:hypothetical protein
MERRHWQARRSIGRHKQSRTTARNPEPKRETIAGFKSTCSLRKSHAVLHSGLCRLWRMRGKVNVTLIGMSSLPRYDAILASIVRSELAYSSMRRPSLTISVSAPASPSCWSCRRYRPTRPLAGGLCRRRSGPYTNTDDCFGVAVDQLSLVGRQHLASPAERSSFSTSRPPATRASRSTSSCRSARLQPPAGADSRGTTTVRRRFYEVF